MSRRDANHDIVRNSLEKDGWTITHDPYSLRLDEIPMGIDLGAEKLIAADRDSRKIAVEVKSFVTASHLSTFHTALGQFLNYRFALDEVEPDRTLYLAVPEESWQSFFAKASIRRICSRYGVKLVVYAANRQEIITWIE